MNYEKIYESLIERARHRRLDGYKERHHIVPKCQGGLDTIDNLVDLTAEEHYLAHQLLVKIYPLNDKLVYAASMMISARPSNKLYGWIRRRVSAHRSISQKGECNSQYGTKWVHNPLTGENKKTSGQVEIGWSPGRYKSKPTKYDLLVQERKAKKEAKVKELTRQYTEMYEIYKNTGFDEFVRITKYNYSQANLVTAFARYVEHFVPQNGKRRKYNAPQ